MESYKTIRIDVPIELNERLKKCVKRDYSNTTSVVRNLIVNYVKEKEKEHGK
jgi:metal-responsive CopG/Arc/MetJ family transcriptional regulator